MCRHSALCGDCTAGECRDAPTEAMANFIRCPLCGEKGCRVCGTGRIKLIACPRRSVTPHTLAVIRAAEFYKKGLPPILAGSIDQSESFLNACELVWSVESAVRYPASDATE